MKRRKDLGAKLHSGFESVVGPDAGPQPWNLFAMAAFRVLLGHEAPLPPGWEEAERTAIAILDDPAATVTKKAQVIAYLALAGQDVSARFDALVLPVARAAEDDVNVTMTGLAGAMKGGAPERDAWLAAGRGRPYIETEQVYLFEMLSLVQTDPGEADRAANAVALLTLSNLLRRDPVSIAPLICGLEHLARRAGGTARALLFDRLATVDSLLFAEGETPRFVCKGPELTAVDGDICQVQLTIRGKGRFDAGVDPAASLTRFLTKHLSAFVVGLSRRREPQRTQLEKALEHGKCLTLLKLAGGVELDGIDEQMLRRRIDLAWECARRQLRGVDCAHEVRIER